MNYVLWLASWYPNTLKPFDGDFIQRHARATALFNKIVVVHLQKDENASITDNIKEEIYSTKNLIEIIVYYHPLKTGIAFLDKLISAKKYKKVYHTVLKNYLKTNGEPNLVHVQVAMKEGLQALYLKRATGIKYLLTEHWTGYHKQASNNFYNQGFFIKSLLKRVLSRSSLLLPVTNDLGETINRNVAEVPYKVIPNVVDTSLFFYKPIEKVKFRFIHVSTMNHHKNTEGILRAAKLLSDENFEFELILLGEAGKSLKDFCSDLFLDNHQIIFKEQISYPEVAKEMQHSSAFILFSIVENLPCVILEALCCGLPVISSNVGGISEVINSSNGILVESKNVQQLKEAMKDMILSYSRYDQQKIAKDASLRFNYSVVGKQISDTYDQVITSFP